VPAHSPQDQNNPYAQEDESTSSAKKIFEDFSVAQVLASALAAATSVLLSSQIGIIGGVIGVAVGGGVAAIASQLYKGILSASAEKIKDKVATVTSPSEDELTSLYPSVDETHRMAQQGTTAMGRHAVGAQDASSLDKTSYQPRVASAGPAAAQAGQPRIASAAVRQKAQAKEDAALKRKAILVVAGVTIAAVLVFALIVNVITAGSGIGTKTAPLFVSETTVATTTAATSKPASTQAATTPKTQAASSSEAATTKAETSATTKAETSATTKAETSATTSATTSAASSAAATTSSSNSKESSGE
jgi:hypothetical protein